MTGHLCCFAPSSRWLILFSCGYIKLWHSQAQLWCIRWEVRSKWKRQRSHGGRTLPGQWRKLSSTLLLSHACLWQCHKKSRGRIACFWSSCNFTAQGCKVHKVQVSKEMQIRYIEKFQSYSWHRFKKNKNIIFFPALLKSCDIRVERPLPPNFKLSFHGNSNTHVLLFFTDWKKTAWQLFTNKHSKASTLPQYQCDIKKSSWNSHPMFQPHFLIYPCLLSRL